MEELIYNLFPPHEAKAINNLIEDESIRRTIKRTIGKQLLDNNVFIDGGKDQILVVTSLAPFAASDDECVKIAMIVQWGMQKIAKTEGRIRGDILPMISEHQGAGLAYRCLISLSFFHGALLALHKRHEAPSPEFYRDIGQRTFFMIEEKDISKHFQQWETFLKEMFI